MPRTCCVLGCNSNLRSKGCPSVTTFSFPKDEDRKKEWLKCINREDYVPTTSSAVCIHHFTEDCIIREISATREDGKVLVIPRERPKLADNAYPSIFLSKPPVHSPRRKCLNGQNKDSLLEEDWAGISDPSYDVATTSESDCVSQNEVITQQNGLKEENNQSSDVAEPQVVIKENPSPQGPGTKCSRCGVCYDVPSARGGARSSSAASPRPPRVRRLRLVTTASSFSLRAEADAPATDGDGGGGQYHKRVVHTGQTLYACPDCPALFTTYGSVQQHRLLHKDDATASLLRDSVDILTSSSAAIIPSSEPTTLGSTTVKSGCDPDAPDDAGSPAANQSESEVSDDPPSPPLAELLKSMKKEKPVKVAKVYSCDVCKDTFSSCQEFRVHRRTHKIKLHCCDTCGKCFQRASKLKVHMRVHSKERPYRCDVCGSQFTQHGNLKIHKRIHSGERPFRCDVCKAAFMQPSHLKVHKRCHTGERPYKCNLCPSAFTQLTSLILHKRSHTGERPFPCDVCELAFNSRGDLKVHKRRHTGERPYRCDICAATFTTLGTLNVHKRRHDGKRSYLCDVCGVAFITHSELKTHKRRHTGEQPYRCDICGSAFTQVGSLNTHKKRHKENSANYQHPSNEVTDMGVGGPVLRSTPPLDMDPQQQEQLTRHKENSVSYQHPSNEVTGMVVVEEQLGVGVGGPVMRPTPPIDMDPQQQEQLAAPALMPPPPRLPHVVLPHPMTQPHMSASWTNESPEKSFASMMCMKECFPAGIHSHS